MPMSIPVHGVLTAQQREANGSRWVFPAATGDGPLADPRKALEKVSEEIGVRFTSHTLRHTLVSLIMGKKDQVFCTPVGWGTPSITSFGAILISINSGRLSR